MSRSVLNDSFILEPISFHADPLHGQTLSSFLCFRPVPALLYSFGSFVSGMIYFISF
jgi:hypothetical protein